MKKKLLIAALALSALMLAACEKKEDATKSANSAEEGVNVAATESASGDSSETVGEVGKDSFTIEYSEDCFVEDESEGSLDGSTYLMCVVDENHKNDNYVDIRFQDDYSAVDFYQGVKMSMGSGVREENFYFGSQQLEAKYLSFRPAEDQEIGVYIIPHANGSYVVETGAHIYGDDEEEMGYKVSGAMEEVINSIVFDE